MVSSANRFFYILQLLAASPVSAIIVTSAYIWWIINGYSELPLGFFIKIINVEITAIIQTIWFIIIGTGYFISDVGVFIVLSHIKLHLTNLQICIKKLMQNSINDYSKDTHENVKIEKHALEWKYLKKRLKEAVTYHSAILDVSKLVDEAFHLCHLVKFVCLSYLLCLLIYGMTKTGISDGFFWLQFIYAVTLTVLMNIVNYYGNEINIYSQNIANCCYNIDFIGTNIEFQKGLLLIIQRSHLPITMTVGKFAPLSFGTSIAVMRATYSYFMVLHRHH